MLPKTSYAMVHTAKRVLEPRDIPIPDIDAESAIVQIEACGICGSDYEQFEGVLGSPMPAVPGHEPLGKIVAIGDNAAKRWGVDIGDRVAVENTIACHSCDTCLSGAYTQCGSRRIYSYIPLSDAPGLIPPPHLQPHPSVHRVSQIPPPLRLQHVHTPLPPLRYS